MIQGERVVPSGNGLLRTSGGTIESQYNAEKNQLFSYNNSLSKSNPAQINVFFYIYSIIQDNRINLMFKYQQRRKKETYFLNNFLDFKKLRLDL